MTDTLDEWYAVGPGRSTCKRCGEERLVHEVADGRGVQNFCQVCSHTWWLSGPMTCLEYRASLRRTDVSGHLMPDP